jgi:site-specific DNA-methyltransferase (adenine-specific)
MKNHKSRGKNPVDVINSKKKQLPVASNYTYSEWDKKIPCKEIFEEMLRVSKNQIIFGGNYFIEYLFNSSCWIVWDKNNGNNDFADCELAWTSFKTAVRKIKFKWHGMLQEHMNWKEKRVHPTQKPIALGRWLLKNYAKEGNKILDPFAGSGSFLVACKQLDFDFIGFEINKEYVDIANKRLNQQTLFSLKTEQKTL